MQSPLLELRVDDNGTEIQEAFDAHGGMFNSSMVDASVAYTIFMGERTKHITSKTQHGRSLVAIAFNSTRELLKLKGASGCSFLHLLQTLLSIKLHNT